MATIRAVIIQEMLLKEKIKEKALKKFQIKIIRLRQKKSKIINQRKLFVMFTRKNKNKYEEI